MNKPQRQFPWKIARQFYFGHLIFVVVTLVLAGFSLRYYVYSNFVNTADIHKALARFDSYLSSLFFTIFLGAAVYLAFSTRFYTRPLGRLIQRAGELRALDSAQVAEEEIDEGELSEEPGEWYDLDRAINSLHRELREKSDAFSREREELSALIGAVTEAILAVDRDGNTLFYNPQCALLFNVGSKGRTWSLNETFREPEVLNGFEQVLKSGRPVQIPANVRTTHHALARHFAISIAPLRSSPNEPVYGAIGVFHDITEMKQSEQIRIEFVGNASHELRTPLTSIKGYVDTLRDDMKAGRQEMAEQFLEIIGRNVDRLILLVNDLLDLSIIESGAELKKSTVHTRELTEGLLRQLEVKRAAKKQEIRVHYGTETMQGDARRVEQVLVNLVHNAIKYLPEGKRIDLYWDRVKGASVLRVKDNGPGIPYEHQGRLFERFYRVDPGRSRETGGTGLGLSIIKHIMLKHGGNVRLVSRPGEGAEFICTFPD